MYRPEVADFAVFRFIHSSFNRFDDLTFARFTNIIASILAYIPGPGPRKNGHYS